MSSGQLAYSQDVRHTLFVFLNDILQICICKESVTSITDATTNLTILSVAFDDPLLLPPLMLLQYC